MQIQRCLQCGLVLTALAAGMFNTAAVRAQADGERDALLPPSPIVLPSEPLELEPAAFETTLSQSAPSRPAPNPAAAATAARKKRADLQKTVAGAYKPLFFDNNFAYLDNPLYDDWFPGDRLKRNRIGDLITVDIGGQFRIRQHHEKNMRSFGLTGFDDDFLLYRTRLFTNVQIGEPLRVYAEYIDAESNYENRPPRGIEVNRSDFLNLFGDAMLLDTGSGKLTFRGGRQELLYGSERLISPLDWANTRRTFEGYKLFWVGEDWNIDAFWTRPVIVNPQEFDSASYSQSFYGTWATYKGVTDQTLDLYWTAYDNHQTPNNFNFYTTGGRWLGTEDAWLWDLEGGTQFGSNTNTSDHWAWFGTAGLGHKFEDRPWKPTLWFYYDYASGGAARGQGTGFNQLFPLAHKYLGFMDLFGRSNIESPNVLLTMQPHEKVKALLWYYYFFLADGRDTPYNVNSAPFAAGSAPGSRELGHEIDMVLTYTINPRMDVLLGYSYFFSGKYYTQTPGLAYRGDANFLYTHFQWNF